MLLLWDRNVFSYRTIQLVLQAKAHLLARVKNELVFRSIQQLSAGSYLAKVYPSFRHRRRDEDGILMRIIEYTFDDPQRPAHQQRHRLLTTLLDPELDPAVILIVLYHERWEEEQMFQKVTEVFGLRGLVGGTPQGCIFQLAFCLLLDNMIQVVRGYIAEG
jgi:hypothetical protein